MSRGGNAKYHDKIKITNRQINIDGYLHGRIIVLYQTNVHCAVWYVLLLINSKYFICVKFLEKNKHSLIKVKKHYFV